jgi:hypothetical protein
MGHNVSVAVPVVPQHSRGMAALSGGFYAMAHEITVSMVKQGLHEGGSYRYTASVIILLQACLEAYINEFIAFNRHLNPQEMEPKLAKLNLHNRSSLVSKWLTAPLLFGSKTFERGVDPFQSFTLLVSLRNTLGHYDPRFRTPTEFPTKEVVSLQNKFRFSYPGASDWTTQILNLECAKWGCRTVKALIPKFHEFVGGIDFSSSAYPWPDAP